MKIKLLSVTPAALELIYAAGRQCYLDGWVGDLWVEDLDDVCLVNPKDKELISTPEMVKLVNYLKESGHTSVLEHVKFTFAIDDVSRALTHQLVRHRLASYSQQSQRYVKMSVEFSLNNFITPPKIKNNSEALAVYEGVLRHIQATYNRLIALNIDPEDARYVFPNAAKTRIIVTMNCVALSHFFGLRCCTLAQWEIRNLANKMLSVCKEELPCVFEDSGSRCVSLGYCPESKKRSCGKYPIKKEALIHLKDF